MQYFYPPDLPITSSIDEISTLIKEHQVVVIAGDTGSGKTTQLPKICLETFSDDQPVIGCTQPRRVAATSVAARVREELGSDNDLVGCKIRFLDQTSSDTKIKFMTDGILLAETRQDPLLRKYDIIIVDEAHERSLNIDFLIGYLKNLITKRDDLKLIITSATIDTQLFSHHFNNAPIFEIEGRGFPVDIIYKDIEEQDITSSFLEHAIELVSEIANQWPPGDILLFMPTEKDIRTTVEILSGRLADHSILPLFGRLQFSDQQKIFRQGHGYKVIVATNVAETSVTVPGISYVVDTGLARISSYNPRSRTTGLPVTRISQASCNQRAGRCGRVGPGTCFRLFSVEDFEKRPEFTVPEIKRSNLADVLLQMASLNLGNPLDFPFLEPPSPASVREGFRLLEELGAMSGNRKLTRDGRLMARLPIDPLISRIIIEASTKNCLTEITIIASALAIQDPKIRPADQERRADEAHKVFAHPHSDFMSLLSIWNDFHSDGRTFSWSRLKRFCREHFLSFQRMREWLDLHDQLVRILKKSTSFTFNKDTGSYEQIHRSLLSGFFRQAARRKKGNIYNTDGMKEIMVFPGSHQFSKSGDWIISGSYIETARLYALTIATIEPEWIEAAARKFCSYSWVNIRWQKKTGRVVADENVYLRGLVIITGRTVNFGRRDSKNIPEARTVFIREALVENRIGSSPAFHQHNRALLEKWQQAEDKLRKKDIVIQDDTIFSFYDRNLPHTIYDRSTLTTHLKDSNGTSLFMKESDILLRQPEDSELLNFPPSLNVGSEPLKLSYDFNPGTQTDGVTVHLPLSIVNNLRPDIFEWLVPGLLREKTVFLIKGLPKKIRKHLIPVNRSVDRILDNMNVYRGNYYRELSSAIYKLFKISVTRNDWPQQLPIHLQMRFCVLDHEGKELRFGRELSLLQSECNTTSSKPAKQTLKATDRQLLSRLEKTIFTSWDFESVPLQIPLSSGSDRHVGYLFGAVKAMPHLQGVTIIYCGSLEEAVSINSRGTRYLLQLCFKDQHKLVKKYCKVALSGPSIDFLKNSYGGTADVQNGVIEFFQKTLFGSPFESIISRDEFMKIVSEVRETGYYQKGQTLIDQIMSTLRSRREVFDLITKFETLSVRNRSAKPDLYKELFKHLEKVVPLDFLDVFTEDQLRGVKRYLKSLSIRTERAYTNPGKDQQKQKLIERYLNNEETFKEKGVYCDDEIHQLFTHYSHLVAEYQVSLFSPEIKTVTPVSEKKLQAAWRQLNASY